MARTAILCGEVQATRAEGAREALLERVERSWGVPVDVDTVTVEEGPHRGHTHLIVRATDG